MNNRMKKLMSIFLAMLMIFSALPFAVYAEDEIVTGSCGANVTYTLNLTTGEMIISGTGRIEDYFYVSSQPWGNQRDIIKELLVDNGVTKIGQNAFAYCSNLTSVTISDSVTSIVDTAFQNCSNLTSVNIPDSVTSISNDAFNGTAIYNNKDNWENGVLYIGNHLIKAETSISGNCKIKSGTITIADYAFYDCSSLTSVTIPDSVTSIGSYAFYNCNSLESVTIPNSVTSIGGLAFGYCSNLTSAIIPDSVIGISSGAFQGTAIYNDKTNWENGVLYIGNHLIKAETSISGNYTMKSNTITIAAFAFNGCSKLTGVTFPDSLKTIGSGAFYECSKLKSVTIPDSVTSIGSYAFYECSELTSVKIGNSVTSIGDDAFFHCVWLASVTIPDSVTNIGFMAFRACYALRSVTIPSKVKKLEGTFSNCDALKKITILNPECSILDVAYFGPAIPKTTTIYGYLNSTAQTYAEEHINSFIAICDHEYDDDNDSICNLCGWKRDITIIGSCGDNVNWELASDGTLTISGIGNIWDFDALMIGIPWSGYLKDIKTVIIEDGVTGVGEMSFYNCYNLTSVIISDSVTSIGESTFSGCKSLTDVIIPDSVTNLGKSAFNGCSGLTNVTIGSSVTSIGGSTFSGCSSLTSVTIPDGVTSIGDYAFMGCNSLTNITIPDSVISIGGFAFGKCSNLTSVIISDNVTSIGGGAFSYCSSLKTITVTPDNKKYTSDGGVVFNKNKTSIVQYPSGNEMTSYIIPDSVTSIKSCSFRGANNLTSVTIGDSVTSIGDNSFKNCANLKSVTIGNSVITIERSAFESCDELEFVTVGNSVKTIVNSAFWSCGRLKSIIIPDSVETIEKSAFSFCNALEKIVVLRPDCIIETAIPTSTTVVGYANSTAQTYAEEHGNEFVPISNDISEIRDLMFNRTESKAVYYNSDGITAVGLFTHSKSKPESGDYLRFNINGVVPEPSTNKEHIYSFNLKYHTTKAQEDELTEYINTLFRNDVIGLNSLSDSQSKARAIYDFLCDNVNYVEYRKDSGEAFSAYSALIHHEANCQGFALAFYRLALTAGINARIVTNDMNSDEPHAWNIVEIDGTWYQLDASAGAGYKVFEAEFEKEHGNKPGAGFVESYKNAFFMTPIDNNDRIDYSWNTTAPEVRDYNFAKPNNRHYIVSGKTGNLDWSMNLSSRELVITGSGAMPDYDFNNFAPWAAYAIATGLKTVVIGNGVETVDDFAFVGCDEIEIIYIPDSVRSFDAGVLSASAKIHRTNGASVNHGVISYNDKRIGVCGHPDVEAYAFCESCGMYFTNKGLFNGSGHNPVTIAGKLPTCTNSGFSDSSVCTVCGVVLTDSQVIPSLGHVDNNGDNRCDLCHESLGDEDEPQSDNIFVRITNFFKNIIKKFLALFKKKK